MDVDDWRTIIIGVAPKPPTHPYFGYGSDMAFVVNGVSGAPILLVRGMQYLFNVNTIGSTFYMTTSNRGGVGFPERITKFQTTQSETVVWAPDVNTPVSFYYQSGNQEYMGGSVMVFESVADMESHQVFEGMRRAENDISQKRLQFSLDFINRMQSIQRTLMFDQMPRLRHDMQIQIDELRALVDTEHPALIPLSPATPGMSREDVDERLHTLEEFLTGQLGAINKQLADLNEEVSETRKVVDQNFVQVAEVTKRNEEITARITRVHTELHNERNSAKADFDQVVVEIKQDLRASISESRKNADNALRTAVERVTSTVTQRMKRLEDGMDERIILQVGSLFREEERTRRETLRKDVEDIVDKRTESAIGKQRMVSEAVLQQIIAEKNDMQDQVKELEDSWELKVDTLRMRDERKDKAIDKLTQEVSALKDLVRVALSSREQQK